MGQFAGEYAMVSVTETVGGSRAARTYLRSGLVLTVVMFVGFPVLSALDGRWPEPVTSGMSLLVLAIVAVVGAAHLVLVRPVVVRGGPAPQLLGAVALVAATGGTVLVGTTAPALGAFWCLVPGVALSALLAARGWSRPDLAGAASLALAAIVTSAVTGFPRAGPWYVHLLLGVLLLVPPLTDLCSIWLIAVFDRLERARRDAAELATAQERVRIAAELHDVQGHSLHAIAMHAELTERLVSSDSEAAARHAHTVRTLATDALAETRALVRGYRDADLAGELRNAAGLLRAAGADARVTGDPAAVPAEHAVLLGPVVREGATNALRHSDPSQVIFSVRRVGDRTELEVTNDGVREATVQADSHGGTGLAGLRDRVGKGGGTVEAVPDGVEGWRLRVVLLSAAEDSTDDIPPAQAE